MATIYDDPLHGVYGIEPEADVADFSRVVPPVYSDGTPMTEEDVARRESSEANRRDMAKRNTPGGKSRAMVESRNAQQDQEMWQGIDVELGLAEAPQVGMAGAQDWGSLQAQGINPGDPSYMLGAAGLQRGNELESQAWDTAQAVATAPSTTVKTPNALHGPAQALVSTSKDANQGILQATEDAGSAAFGRDLARMSIMAKQQAEVAALTEAREAAEARREQRLADQHMAQLASQEEVTKAADAFKSAPDEDPGRFWASKSAFQKVMLTISAIAKGWLQGQGFNVDPMGTIKAGIREDIEAQRSNRALLGERLTARERQARGAFEVYDQLRGQVIDESTRDEVIFNGRMRAIEAELAKAQAEAAVNMTSAEVDLLMENTRKEIAESDFRLAAVAAKNPEFFTKVVKARTVQVAGPDGKMRTVPVGFASKAAEKGLDRAEAARTQGMNISARGALMEGGEQAAVAWERRAALAAKDAPKDTAQQRYETATAYRLKQDTAVDQGVVDQVVDLKKKYGGRDGDLPGFGTIGVFGTMKMTDAQQAAFYDIVNTLTRSLRPETGAAYTAQEIDNASGGIINEGRTPEENSALQQAVGILKGADEEDVWHILDEVEKKHRRRIKHLQEGVPRHILEQAKVNADRDTTPRALEQVDEPDVVNWND